MRNIITKEDFKLIRTPNKIITDIYYDTSNNLLFNTGASFRLRKQQKLDGWISCFKKHQVWKITIQLLMIEQK